MNINIFHIKTRSYRIGILFLFTIAGFSCGDDVEKGSFITSNELNISSYLKDAEDYSMFFQLLDTIDLFDALNSYNPYGDGFTVFAPTDSAIKDYIEASDTYDSFEALLADESFINVLVRFHIVLSPFNTNSFPFGTLNDSTITGDYLTIGFQTSGTESFYLVNNYAVVCDPNIELINGVIHGISSVLEPIVLSSYEWLKNQEGVNIFTELLEETGLADSMGIFKIKPGNKLARNWYTLFVEPDSVYQKRGINSFQDLVDLLATPGLPYTDKENGINQFAAYHLLEQVLYLDDMTSGIYNTFTSLPIQVSAGIDIKLNPGYKQIFLNIVEGDSVFLDYVPIQYEISNNPSKNGPIHFLSELLEQYKPPAGRISYHFHSEPVINELQKVEGRFDFEDPTEFEVISWSGIDKLTYVKGSEAVEAWEDDFIELDGSFEFTFKTPRVFPGKYDFKARIQAKDYDNAVIQISLDGKRIGTNINLKSSNGRDEFILFTLGNIDFLDYSSHTISITTVIPGKMQLDMLRFDP